MVLLKSSTSRWWNHTYEMHPLKLGFETVCLPSRRNCEVHKITIHFASSCSSSLGQLWILYLGGGYKPFSSSGNMLECKIFCTNKGHKKHDILAHCNHISPLCNSKTSGSTAGRPSLSKTIPEYNIFKRIPHLEQFGHYVFQKSTMYVYCHRGPGHYEN